MSNVDVVSATCFIFSRVTAKKHRTEESTATDRKKNQDKLKEKKITRQRLSKINSVKYKETNKEKKKEIKKHMFSSEYTSKT